MTDLADILHDALTVARRELALAFQGRRSVLLIVGLMALAALPAAARAVGAGQDGAALQQAQVLAMVQVFPREVVRYLLDCPQPLIVGILATLFFQPAYVLLVGSETLAGEIESGSIRFSAARFPDRRPARQVAGLVGDDRGADLGGSRGHLGDVDLGSGGQRRGGRALGTEALSVISCAVALVPVSLVILLGASAAPAE